MRVEGATSDDRRATQDTPMTVQRSVVVMCSSGSRRARSTGGGIMDPIAVVALFVGLLALALEFTAWHWGVDSRDGPESSEWERRRHWRGYGASDWRE
jgi:hypothetical protein